jgi:hypothetical protein
MRLHLASKRNGLKKRTPLAIIFILIVTAGFVHHSQSPGFTSAEVKFADSSPHGLSIMPASCASPPVAFAPTGQDPSGCTVVSSASASAACTNNAGEITISWTFEPGTQTAVTLRDPNNIVLVSQNFAYGRRI